MYNKKHLPLGMYSSPNTVADFEGNARYMG